MSNTKRKIFATLDKECRDKYNKYGEWIDGVYLPYDDMEMI